MEPVLDAFAAWGVRDRGLFTWPHGPKHLMLYQRCGFWPHAVTAVVASAAVLDLTEEARGTVAHGLGDVVLTDGGFAICQTGAGTEAGGGALYVKFAAVAPATEPTPRPARGRLPDRAAGAGHAR